MKSFKQVNNFTIFSEATRHRFTGNLLNFCQITLVSYSLVISIRIIIKLASDNLKIITSWTIIKYIYTLIVNCRK
jgi:hypothetical protein